VEDNRAKSDNNLYVVEIKMPAFIRGNTVLSVGKLEKKGFYKNYLLHK
jgi:hypothetical protein